MTRVGSVRDANRSLCGLFVYTMAVHPKSLVALKSGESAYISVTGHGHDNRCGPLVDTDWRCNPKDFTKPTSLTGLQRRLKPAGLSFDIDSAPIQAPVDKRYIIDTCLCGGQLERLLERCIDFGSDPIGANDWQLRPARLLNINKYVFSLLSLPRHSTFTVNGTDD